MMDTFALFCKILFSHPIPCQEFFTFIQNNLFLPTHYWLAHQTWFDLNDIFWLLGSSTFFSETDLHDLMLSVLSLACIPDVPFLWLQLCFQCPLHQPRTTGMDVEILKYWCLVPMSSCQISNQINLWVGIFYYCFSIWYYNITTKKHNLC